MTTYDKIAVISNVSSNLSVEVINSLLIDGYYVVGMYDERSGDVGLIREMKTTKGVCLVEGTTIGDLCWELVRDNIKTICDSLGLEERLDLLINIPGGFLEDNFDNLDEGELDTVLTSNLIGTFNSIKMLKSLCSKTDDSKIVNIYSHSHKGSKISLAGELTSSCLDVITEQLSKEFKESKTSVTSLCPAIHTLQCLEDEHVRKVIQGLKTIIKSNEKEFNGEILLVQK